MMMPQMRKLWKPVKTAVVWTAVVFLWEGASIPASSHSNSWQGIWGSLGLLAFCSYRLAKCEVPSRWVCLYGCASAVLFAPRFLSWDRFQLWLPYVFPTNWHVALLWLGIACGLGLLSWAAAQMGIAKLTCEFETSSAPNSSESQSGNHSELATPIRIQSADIFVWLALIVGYFSSMWYWSSVRQFLEKTFSVPDVVSTIANGLVPPTAIAGTLSYLRQRTRSRRFFDEPGDRLLVAVAVQSGFDFLARGSQVALSGEETIWLVPDSLEALEMSGRILAGLVFLSPLEGVNRRWRWTLRVFAILSFVSLFAFNLPKPFQDWASISSSAVFLGLVLNSIIQDWQSRHNYQWPHWLGCTTLFANNVGWLLSFLLTAVSAFAR